MTNKQVNKTDQREMVSNYRSRNKEGWNAYQRQYQRKRTAEINALKRLRDALKEYGLVNDENEVVHEELAKCYKLEKDEFVNLTTGETIPFNRALRGED